MIVHVWLIRLDVPEPALGGLEAVLGDVERARAAALGQPGQQGRFTVAHGTARLIIGRFAGIPAREVDWRYGPNGKPELGGACRDVQISLSHSANLAALAVAVGRRVGVDLQRLPTRLDVPRMVGRFYPPDDARFVLAAGPDRQPGRYIRLWTRKEACVKVTGGVLMEGLRLPVRGRGPVLVHDPGGPLPGPYLVRDVTVPRLHRAAVAAEGTQTYEVTRHWWPAP